MAELEKVIKGFECCMSIDDVCQDCPYDYDGEEGEGMCLRGRLIPDALELLKEQEAIKLLEKQKQIKSPDEFKSLLLGMFDSIWDVEIDHPVFQDTVGELMEGVLQAYRLAVKWE